MKWIADLSELEGKTIQTSTKTMGDGIDDVVALTFSDGSCCVIAARTHGEVIEMELLEEHEVNKFTQKEAGIITQAQYEAEYVNCAE